MEMMSARPTAASAAATPIEKMTNMMPINASGCGPYRQNAMKFRLAALSMSSMPISTRMAFRRVKAPARPMAKRSEERMRYALRGVMKGKSSKSQAPNPKPQHSIQSARLEFGFWAFFVTWDLGFGISFRLLFPHGDDDGSDQGGGEQEADDFERQDVTGHQLVADLAD